MAKSRPDATPKSSAKRATLSGLRGKIDRVDREIVKLCGERAKLVLNIDALKKASGEAAYQPAREADVLAKVAAFDAGPLPQSTVEAVFRELISGCRALEKELQVAYLGPAYSYSHLAALDRFGGGVQLAPVANIAAVFEEVDRGHADYGLAPIENSTDGRVADTLGMFTRTRVRICGEVQLPIHHHLLGKCSLNDVREVHSKPQALSQCRNWLARRLPDAQVVEVASTSAAAQIASEKPGAAAIASVEAGRQYGLDVLQERIEDSKTNTTRFAVIGKEVSPRTGDDKTALMLEVAHSAGALADVINVFKRQRLNLTWIESFPVADLPGEYVFFVELEGHEAEPRVKRAMASLEKKTLRLVVLGSYPRAKRHADS